MARKDTVENGTALPPLLEPSAAAAPAAPESVAAALLGQTQDAMGALAVGRASREPKKRYAFWETQPVSQFNEQAAAVRAWQRHRLGNRTRPPGPVPAQAGAVGRQEASHIAARRVVCS